MTAKQKIILVFGLPGAGKSTLINDAVKEDESLIRLSGGTLIGRELTEAERDNLRKLEANEILRNQELLVLGFSKAVQENPHKTIIFDGHCVVKNGNNFVEIPTSIIERLNPSLILFLKPSAEEIELRRRTDISRPDREVETIAQIAALQEKQITVCQQYSRTLNVNLEIIESPSAENFKSALLLVQ